MAVGECISLAAIQNFASKDVNRIIGQIGRVLARKSPYINSIDGGTLPNVSDVVRSVVEEMAVPAASLAAPTFVNDTTLCGVGATPDVVGSTEYQFHFRPFAVLGLAFALSKPAQRSKVLTSKLKFPLKKRSSSLSMLIFVTSISFSLALNM